VPNVPSAQPPALAISNHVVKLLRECTGRGPTRARTHFSDDLVTVVIEDLLTKAERKLTETGQRDLVLQTRRIFQETMADDLTDAVETITGRRVLAFLSANHVEPDIAIESFVLAPQDGGPVGTAH
jgi:uncharacterized protein YbcI